MKTKLQSILSATALAFALSAASHTAHAAICSVTDMTFNEENADACYNGAGNPNLGAINGIGGAFADPLEPWVFLLKGEEENAEPPESFKGYDFDLTDVVFDDTSGEFTLTVTGAPLPVMFDFVGVLKGGSTNPNSGVGASSFAAYLFENAQFAATNTGTWTITFTNPGGNTPGLSNFSIYIRDAEGGIPPTGNPVPEPGILFLMGAGLLGLGMARRRKSA